MAHAKSLDYLFPVATTRAGPRALHYPLLLRILPMLSQHLPLTQLCSHVLSRYVDCLRVIYDLELVEAAKQAVNPTSLAEVQSKLLVEDFNRWREHRTDEVG
jgi:hypothetical protein